MMKPLPSFSAPFACGDIVVVPFPFSDRLAEKCSPALVVSDARLAKVGLVWLVMITSAQHSASSYDCAIADLPRAGLRAASLVRPTKIAAVEPVRILRRAGQLGAAKANRVVQILRQFVGPELPIRQGTGP